MMRAQGLVDKCSQWAGEGRARGQLHIIRMQSTPGHITASVVLLLAAVVRATAPYENTTTKQPSDTCCVLMFICTTALNMVRTVYSF